MAMAYGVLTIFAAIVILSCVSSFYYTSVIDPCGTSKESSDVGCAIQVTCENNKSVMYFNYGEYQAKAIVASNSSSSSSSFHYIITGVSPHNNCPIINSLSLPYENVSFFTKPYGRSSAFVRCEKPVDYLTGIYWDIISSERCGEEKQYYSYLVQGDEHVSNIAESCRVEMKIMMSGWDGRVICNSSKCVYPEVHSEYVNGIEVRWQPIRCQQQQQGRDTLLFDAGSFYQLLFIYSAFYSLSSK